MESQNHEMAVYFFCVILNERYSTQTFKKLFCFLLYIKLLFERKRRLLSSSRNEAFFEFKAVQYALNNTLLLFEVYSKKNEQACRYFRKTGYRIGNKTCVDHVHMNC